MRVLPPLSEEDLGHVLKHTSAIWKGLAGKTLLITGGTGFFGKWLLESLCQANRIHCLGTSALVLTRNPTSFQEASPHLARDSALRFIAGDVRDFTLAPTEHVDYVIHAATPASATMNAQSPLAMFNVIVDGTRHVLDLAVKHQAHRVLLVSSGAAYGKQPSDIHNLPETYGGAPDPLDPLSAYGEGKRQSEHICALYGRTFGLSFSVARCFAFLGPHLPLDGTYALGNFVRDALCANDAETLDPLEITVEGEGRMSSEIDNRNAPAAGT